MLWITVKKVEPPLHGPGKADQGRFFGDRWGSGWIGLWISGRDEGAHPQRRPFIRVSAPPNPGVLLGVMVGGRRAGRAMCPFPKKLCPFNDASFH